MTHRSTKRLGAVLAAALVFAACGSDDEPAASESTDADAEEAEEPADEPAEEPAEDEGEVTPPPDEEEVGDDGDDDMIVIDDFDDIPGECVDLMGEFLRAIEDDVSAVDWQTATIDDIEAMGDSLDAPTNDFDARMEETGCDRYDIGVDDEQSLQFAIRVAERDAPDTVPWLEFIASFATAGAAVDDAIGMDEDSGGEMGSPGPDGDLPADCEGTKEYLLGIAEEYETIDNLPISEITTLSTAVQNLTVQCTIGDATAFYENPTIAAFLEG